MAEQYPSIMIIGLGKTGYSCARFLAARGTDYLILDTREEPPYLKQLKADQPNAQVRLGVLDENVLKQAGQLIVSPGMAINHPAIAGAVNAGVKISSDIDLFCETVTAPVIAITGSNAKSTVTTMVGLMAEQAGKKVGVGGNLGTPVLELAESAASEPQDPMDLYVIELSSFQLEVSSMLAAEVATILNLSPDHMDRYSSYEDYRQAKQRVYRNCRHAVVNRDDSQTQCLFPVQVGITGFGLSQPKLGDFGVSSFEGENCLAIGEQMLMPVSEMKLKGSHNISNALAALAIGSAVGLPLSAMLATLRDFEGLPHRCQWVRELGQVNYYNDSKGTNVGATLAAVKGFGEAESGKIVLILGGVAKDADFSELLKPVHQYCRAVVLIGRDASQIEQALMAESEKNLLLKHASSMEGAVGEANNTAQPGDLVLLSPACASFDMFENFEARGDAFCNAVRAL